MNYLSLSLSTFSAQICASNIGLGLCYILMFKLITVTQGKGYFTLLYFNVQISSLLFRFLFYNLIIPIRKRNTCFHLCFFLLIGTTSLEARCQKCMGYQIYPWRICPWKHIFNTSWARASLGEHETWARLDRWRGGTPIFWTVFISWE